jgi:PKD repeat protein
MVPQYMLGVSPANRRNVLARAPFQQPSVEIPPMIDFTASAGEAYAACKVLFEDLNRVANDFGHAFVLAQRAVCEAGPRLDVVPC